MADSAPTVPAAPAAAPGTQQTTANTHPEAKPGETKAQTVARLRADLGDGEQEYDQSHVLELARRGRQSAKIMSKAEERLQAAQRKDREADQRLSRLKSKDLKERRAALKELGFDELEFAKAVAQETMEAEQLTPEQRRIRELELQLQAEEESKAKAKKDEEAKALDADTQRHVEDFSNLFLDVMQRAGLPRESAQVAYYRLAAMYQTADAAGEPLDPDLAAAHLKTAMREEHTALFRKKDGTLDLDAFEASLTTEDWKALNKRAVEKYMASRGTRPVEAPAQQAPAQPTNGATSNGAKRPVGSQWFRELQKRFG